MHPQRTTQSRPVSSPPQPDQVGCERETHLYAAIQALNHQIADLAHSLEALDKKLAPICSSLSAEKECGPQPALGTGVERADQVNNSTDILRKFTSSVNQLIARIEA